MAEETASQIVTRLYATWGYRPDEITDALLAELRVNRHARDVLYTWVRDRVQHAISRMGRYPDGEREADRRRQLREGTATRHSQRSHSASDSQGRSDPLQFLLARVPCPGAKPYPGETRGGWKFFRDFTVADHQARITLHQLNRDGAQDRMDGHTWARQMLERHTATTLADIPSEVIAAELPEGGVRA